jgi:UDP:flavonoid glycosyltransferase YjiC (YdhE family)
MKLNVENLSGAIREAAERETMRANAQALSEKIRREDGLIETVRWVECFLA